MKHPLSNVHVWNFFRSALEVVFKFYSRRVALLKELGFRGDESVLDIGCGTGEHSGITRSAYLGVDLNPEYVAFASDRYPAKKFICMDVANLQLPSRAFDVALMVDLVHHLPTKDALDLFQHLTQLTHKVYFFEPVTQSSKNWIGRLITSMDRGGFIRSKGHLLTLIDRCFEIREVRDCTFLGTEGICVVAVIRQPI